MQHVTMTPFGRQTSALALCSGVDRYQATPALREVDKWKVFESLKIARRHFGLSSGSLTAFRALLSFLPKKLDADAEHIVFASNVSLARRADGMPESTLRRHIKALVNAGLICRRDSPNRKRYVARATKAGPRRAYGFDLRPFLDQAAQITQIAADVTEAEEILRQARARFVLLLQDASTLLIYVRSFDLPGDWAKIADHLARIRAAKRRKMDMSVLADFSSQLGDILPQLHAALARQTSELSGNDSQNERHDQNQEAENIDLEEANEQRGTSVVPGEGTIRRPATATEPVKDLPLRMIIAAFPKMMENARHGITSVRDFLATAGTVSRDIGISPALWQEAQEIMGPANAAIVIAEMLERFSTIQVPRAYLRHLCQKAARNELSVVSLVIARLNRFERPRGGLK